MCGSRSDRPAFAPSAHNQARYFSNVVLKDDTSELKCPYFAKKAEMASVVGRYKHGEKSTEGEEEELTREAQNKFSLLIQEKGNEIIYESLSVSDVALTKQSIDKKQRIRGMIEKTSVSVIS